MQNSLLKILGILAIIATLVCFIFAALGMIGAVSIGNGCYMRYDGSGKGGMDSITSTATLNANANYVTTSTMQPDGTTKLTPDPRYYGKWLNTQVSVEDQQAVTLQIVGQISLCLAYVPKDNLQFTESTRPGKSNLDDNDKMIPIPRTTDANTEPLSLIIDARNNEWRNITELYANDRVLISVSPNYSKAATAVKDAFRGSNITADCLQNQTSYNPICGKYSIYSGKYVNACEYRENYWQGDKHREECHCIFGCIHEETVAQIVCDAANAVSHCCLGFTCRSLSAWISRKDGIMPEVYKDDGTFTFSWADNTGSLFIDYEGLQCSNNEEHLPNGKCPDSVEDRSAKDKDYIGGASCQGDDNGKICNSGDFQKNRRFWYTADGNGGSGPTGLMWQLTPNGSVDQTLPSKPQFAKFVASSDQPPEYDSKYKVIYNISFNSNTPSSYLQYRLWSPTSQDASKNTGGYVLNIKQTKCYRENGNSFSDDFSNRGQVQYVIVPSAEDPNTNNKYSPEAIIVNSEGKANFTANGEGYVWMRILNAKDDYKDSEGSYKVNFSTSLKVGSFTLKVMDPLLKLFKSKVQGAAQSIFQNMVCYGGDTSSCTNLFNYIKAILILYIMVYGAMFLLGFAKINQKELITRMIKIIIVSGLMNGNTFEFFNNYLFNVITGFSDEIISNMSGYSLFTSINTISNPFMFLDAVMSKIFFSQTFIAQLLALLSLGLSGIIYFIITFIALVIVIIMAFRAIAVYIMAFMATCILIGIAPLFISFLLFDFTRYLFDNWVRFTIRYMIEPVIMMAGIIVLTQLFTIYLDFVLGYSVCWKCALPIKIPFIGTILPIALLNVPIFCINWFAPWGMDYMSGMMGVNMQNIVALVIIAYGMYGYVEFSGRMTAKLTSAAGPSATEMGNKMSSAAGQKALGQVGMDEKTRGDIAKRAKERLAKRNETLDQAKKK